MENSWTNNLADWITGRRNNRVNSVKQLLKETVKKRISASQAPSVRMSDLLRNESPTLQLDIMEIGPLYTSTLQNIILAKSRKSKNLKKTPIKDSITNISDLTNDETALISESIMGRINNKNSDEKENIETSTKNGKNFEITKPADELNYEKSTRNDKHIYENVPFENDNKPEVIKPKIQKPKRKYPPGKKPFVDLNESNDSQIINELVLDKYSNALDYFRNRSFQRSNKKRNNKIADYINDDDNDSLISGFSSALPSPVSFTDAAFECGNDFYFQKNMDNSIANSISIDKIDDDDELDDTKSMGSTVLCDDIQNNPLHFIITEEKSVEERSINTDDLSDLLSKGSTEDIHREVSIQEEFIFQTSKAINFCNRNKKFTFGLEQVEAERLLLIASCTKDILLKELKNKDHHELESQDSTNCFIKISNITIPYKYTHMEDTIKDVSTYFVCLATCGTKVIASPVIKAKEGSLKIPIDFLFRKLNRYFELTVSIYALQVNNKKPTVKKTKKSFASPIKLFQMAKNHCHKNVTNVDDEVLQTSFVLWCQMTVDKQNIQDECYKMTSMSRFSQLDDSVFMEVESEVNLKSDVSGFLTIANYDGNGIIWSRRWCSLEGCRLKYWNYPSEELTKAPMGIIDFQYCISKTIGQADRMICPRQKTLQIQTKNKDIITNHLLSCDNADEFHKWQGQLNYVIDSIRKWNCSAL
ncbi:unnamed protein product [Brassicogethes aeneus]|uniref:PH domain-containing protein n=1 Tax=Brassicogethes aeneus TaxID=1431903 RepID=A0A9P0AXS4_BRAAE|nr:unnamed protein product [Brassicogethes aeneus]